MKTKFQLYMDYVQTNARASELERLAESLKKLADNRLQSSLDQLTKDWTGEASREYISKGAKLKSDILNVSINLINEAQTIRNIAKRTYNTEMKALEMANSRTYH